MTSVTQRHSPRTPQRRFNDTSSPTSRRSRAHIPSSSASSAATARGGPPSSPLRSPSRPRSTSRSAASGLASPKFHVSRSKKVDPSSNMTSPDTAQRSAPSMSLFRPSTAASRLQQMPQGGPTHAGHPSPGLQPRRRRSSSSSSFGCSLAADFDNLLRNRDQTPAGAASSPEERQAWANHLFQRLCLGDRPTDVPRSRRPQHELHRKRERSSSLGRVKKVPATSTPTTPGAKAGTQARNVTAPTSTESSAGIQRRPRRPSLPASASRPVWSHETAPMPSPALDATMNALDGAGASRTRPSRPNTMGTKDESQRTSSAGDSQASTAAKRGHARSSSRSSTTPKVSSQATGPATAPPSPQQPTRPPLPLSQRLGIHTTAGATSGDVAKADNLEQPEATSPTVTSSKRFSFGNLRKRHLTEGSNNAPVKPVTTEVVEDADSRPPSFSPLPRRRSRGPPSGPQSPRTGPQSPGFMLPFQFKAYESGSHGDVGDDSGVHDEKDDKDQDVDAESPKVPQLTDRSSRGTFGSRSSLAGLFANAKDGPEHDDSCSRSITQQHSRAGSTSRPDPTEDASMEELLMLSQQLKSANRTSRPPEPKPGPEGSTVQDPLSNGKRSRESSASRWLFRRSRQESVSKDTSVSARPASACSRRPGRSASQSEAQSPVLGHARSASRPPSRAAGAGPDTGRMLGPSQTSSPTLPKPNFDADPFAKADVFVRSPEVGKEPKAPSTRNSAGPTPGSPSLVRRKRSYPDIQPQAQFMRPGHQQEAQAQYRLLELGKSFAESQKSGVNPLEAQAQPDSASVPATAPSPYGAAAPARSDASLGVRGRIVLDDPTKTAKHTSSSSSNGTSAGSSGAESSAGSSAGNTSSSTGASSSSAATSTSATSSSSASSGGISATLSKLRIPRRFKLGAGTSASASAGSSSSTRGEAAPAPPPVKAESKSQSPIEPKLAEREKSGGGSLGEQAMAVSPTTATKAEQPQPTHRPTGSLSGQRGHHPPAPAPTPGAGPGTDKELPTPPPPPPTGPAPAQAPVQAPITPKKTAPTPTPASPERGSSSRPRSRNAHAHGHPSGHRRHRETSLSQALGGGPLPLTLQWGFAPQSQSQGPGVAASAMGGG